MSQDVDEAVRLAREVVAWADHQKAEYKLPDAHIDTLARAILALHERARKLEKQLRPHHMNCPLCHTDCGCPEGWTGTYE